jgi:hypothetical protein
LSTIIWIERGLKNDMNEIKQWSELSPIERRDERFRRWSSPQGIEFISSEAEKRYKTRATRIIHALKLEESDRVPVEIPAGPFIAHYSGTDLKTIMYNVEEARKAFFKFYQDFDVDAFDSSGFGMPGRTYEILGYKAYRWPSYGLSPDASMVQFVEAEYMKADEYDAFIYNPLDYMLRNYLPRTWKVFEPLQNLPPVSALFGLPQWILSAATKIDIRNMSKTLARAGDDFQIWRTVVGECSRKAMAMGFPSFDGGMAIAPFDFFADSLRGTRGITMDMYRQPEKLLKALDLVTPLIIDSAVAAAEFSPSPLVLMPLHKGDDGFMSESQFKTFYWPSLRKVFLGLMEQGLVPAPIADGRYDTRLEIVKDVPAASMMFTFEKTDMFKAKKVLGKTMCIAGNVSASQLYVCNPQEVKEYCRKLIEICGKGGGYILTLGSTVDKGNSANMRAVVDAAHEDRVPQQ